MTSTSASFAASAIARDPSIPIIFAVIPLPPQPWLLPVSSTQWRRCRNLCNNRGQLQSTLQYSCGYNPQGSRCNICRTLYTGQNLRQVYRLSSHQSYIQQHFLAEILHIQFPDLSKKASSHYSWFKNDMEECKLCHVMLT